MNQKELPSLSNKKNWLLWVEDCENGKLSDAEEREFKEEVERNKGLRDYLKISQGTKEALNDKGFINLYNKLKSRRKNDLT